MCPLPLNKGYPFTDFNQYSSQTRLILTNECQCFYLPVLQLYPSVCKRPTSAKCRVRFLHGDPVDVGQTLAVSCTPTAGLLCQTSDQFGQEACLDYEIRFECPSPFGKYVFHPMLFAYWECN